ncbi:uncharacterized protein LOC106766685 [Vigna radiata var. radiata]|uniref:Uncharacterized protein LOC106766685 n=1 Tax=Vigna radiata var. radiata TaxID=3916 RepID=A0A1S3ULF5_VIGRR|nr:uncharacterized protein LOC106766685 [Vigna radiata var. radiata]
MIGGWRLDLVSEVNRERSIKEARSVETLIFCNVNDSSVLMVLLTRLYLGEMIAAHKRLKEQSQILFIPGCDDAGPSTGLPALPRTPKHIPNAIFSSNSCNQTKAINYNFRGQITS